MKIIDLTHALTGDTPVYPGDPKVSLRQIAHIEKDGYTDHALSASMHVGTHMDAPLHMLPRGQRIDEIDVNRFIGLGALIDVRDKKVVDSSVLKEITIAKESIVLLYSGFGDKYGQDTYFNDFPELTIDFAERLAELGVIMVGMDMLGPEHDEPWAIHKSLLGNNITILENLTNLDQLIAVPKFEVIAMPTKIRADAAPVRVIARIY